jgi:hypothetical protein
MHATSFFHRWNIYWNLMIADRADTRFNSCEIVLSNLLPGIET